MAESARKQSSWAFRIAVGGPLALASVYALVIVLGRPEGLEGLAQIGDAFAPFTVAFTIAAVAVALRSVELQRRELRLQRRELRLQRRELRLHRREFEANREVMKEQREQFERTAEAQEELARAQRRLATAQDRANALTLVDLQAQARQNMVTLKGAFAHVWTAIEDLRARSPNFAEKFEQAMKPVIDNLNALMAQEQGEARKLRRAMIAAQNAVFAPDGGGSNNVDDVAEGDAAEDEEVSSG